MKARVLPLVSLVLLSTLGSIHCVSEPGGDDDAKEGEGVAPSAQSSAPRTRDESDPFARKRVARERQASDPAAQPHIERMTEMRGKLGLSADDTFEPLSVERAEDGSISVRLQHRHKGLRVRGSMVISHADRLDRFTHVTSYLKGGISISTRPSISEAAALKTVEADPTHTAPYSWEPQLELVIAPILQAVDAATGAPAQSEAVSWEENAMPPALNAEEIRQEVTGHTLGYEVTTVEGREGGGELVNSLRYLVDAQSGALIETTSLNEYGTGTSLYNGSVSFNTLGTWDGPGGWEMYDYAREFKVEDDDYGSDEVPNVDTNDTWGDGMVFTNANMANRQTAMVDAAYGGSVYWDLLDNVFGRQGPDDDFYSVNMFVHVGTDWNNASYNRLTGNISCGDGPGNGWTRTRLDTMAHENGHALNDFTAGLTGGEAGGLNESSSDIFGAMVKFYRGGGAFDSHAATIPATGGDWLHSGVRNMMKPSLGGQPDAWYNGISALDVHDSAAPNNRAFYFLSQGATSGMKDNTYSPYLPLGMAGLGVHKAGQIWYRALTQYMGSSTDYAGARSACIQAAQALFGANAPEVDAVRNAYAGINVGLRASSYPVLPNTAETEPNGSLAGANTLSRPVTPKPNGGPDKLQVFGQGSDVDYFTYSAVVGEKILMRLTSVQPYNYDIYVLDGVGSVVAQSTLGAGNYDYINLTATDPWGFGGAQVYYIKIVPSSVGANAWYHLDLDFT